MLGHFASDLVVCPFGLFAQSAFRPDQPMDVPGHSDPNAFIYWFVHHIS